jgi:hypothetical protein
MSVISSVSPLMPLRAAICVLALSGHRADEGWHMAAPGMSRVKSVLRQLRDALPGVR